MARAIHRLSARECKTLPAGLHADGGNLYLQVTPSGSRSWILRYQRDGKARDMGLGPLHTVTLAEARQAATDARKALLRGDDPLAHRRAIQAARAGVPAFREAAAEYIDTHKSGWKNPKHVAQWTNTLTTYAFPVLGDMPVDRIETDDVLAVLKPVWAARTSMVVGAEWSEIEAEVWRVPKERMKGRGMARREFQVPIVPGLRQVIGQLPRTKGVRNLFPGERKPYLSTGAMDALLTRMGFDHFTVHGFRSTFKDWATEKTSTPNIVSEAALAHTIKDKAEAAYRRGELLEKRRELLQAWAIYCGYPAS